MTEFINYGKQWINKDDVEALEEVLKSDYLTQGPKVEEFEKKICQYMGAKYCLAVANGTAALHLAVKALEIEKGKSGITSPNSFLASANCLIYNNLKPDFADIDSKTYNLNPEDLKLRIKKETKVVIPVHFAGQVAEMEKISQLAKDNDLYIIEDAAHAIGSKYENGKKVGGCQYSDMTIFSFHPVKTITTGEGGAITTNNKNLYEKLKLLRTHGLTKEEKYLEKNEGPWYYEMQLEGFNYRLTDIQSALGISQLSKIDKFIKRRREIVNLYNQAFNKLQSVIIPYEKEGLYSAFHLYVLQIDFEKIGKTRTELMNELREKNIGTQVHYIPIHTQPFYQKNFGFRWGDYPVAEEYYQKALSLPLYPKMTDENVKYVIDAFNKAIS